MEPIYVTGHRNPDTDSIVAAMAYAALRNALGDGEFEAACLGYVSDETQRVLDRFGFEPPTLIFNMFTQIKDIDYSTPPVLSSAAGVLPVCNPCLSLQQCPQPFLIKGRIHLLPAAV